MADPPTTDLSYAGVTDMIGQRWLVEVTNDTIVRALKLDDWYEIDLSHVVADGQFDPKRSRRLLDQYLETQEDVDERLLELRVSEEGLPFAVIPPSEMG